MKKYLNDNKFYILFGVGFFLISLFFPYTGDDWYWGTYKLDFTLFNQFHNDIELNGRYLGNLFAVILTRNRIIRGIIMSFVVSMILKLINCYTKTDKKYSLLLFLLMPSVIFKQVVPWSAGFANYMISSLLVLSCLYILEYKDGKKWNIIVLILFICSSLFLENVTIFLLGLTIFLNIYYFVKHKKINKLYFFAFLGSLFGAIIMFIHPTYILSFTGKNPSRFVAGENYGLLHMIKYNYFNSFYVYGINANFAVIALLEFILYFYYLKNMEKYNSKLIILFVLSYLMLIYIIMSEAILFLYKKIYINGVISTIYFILLLYIMYILFKENKKMNFIIKIIVIIIAIEAPLFIVTPIGSRNFLIVNLLLDAIFLKIYEELFSKEKFNKYVNIVVIVFISIISINYLNVFYNVNKVNNKRDNYIKENSCMNILDVPRLPYHKYLWWPDFEESLGYYYPKYYKKYKDLSSNLRFKFYDYNDWEKRKAEISTCS